MVTPLPLFPDRSAFLPAHPLQFEREATDSEDHDTQSAEAARATDAVDISSRTLSAATYRRHSGTLESTNHETATPAPPEVANTAGTAKPPAVGAATGAVAAPDAPGSPAQSPAGAAGEVEARPGAGEEEDSLDPQELSEEEEAEVTKLKDRDREVRAHEHAHLAAAGPYSRGGVQYEYQRGPDGRRYAVGGEVSIDTSKEKNPEDTIRKAQVVRRAAQAPAEPSSQDRRVAAEASRMESRARQELSKQRVEERREVNEEEETSASGEAEEAAVGEVATAVGSAGALPDGAGVEDGNGEGELPEPDVDGGTEIDVDTGSSAGSTFDGAGQGAGQILDLIA